MKMLSEMSWNAPSPRGIVSLLMLTIVLLVLTQAMHNPVLFEAGIIVLFYTTFVAIRVANVYDPRKP
jgi:hypothetical protein